MLFDLTVLDDILEFLFSGHSMWLANYIFIDRDFLHSHTCERHMLVDSTRCLRFVCCVVVFVVITIVSHVSDAAHQIFQTIYCGLLR
jgi:hypothetical protein